ncbi:MAG: vWA domain-containing protein [Kofleriaceae bacterium]
MIRPAVAFVFLVTAGCGSKTFPSLCDDPLSPDECNQVCDPSPSSPESCPPGFHCAPDGKCDLQCTVNGGQCGEGYTCTTDGRCVDDGNNGSNTEPDASCPAINFTPMPVTPSIGLVLDQSGSMFNSNIGGVQRYKAMRDALVSPTGVVTQLEAKAYFGSLLYTCSGNNTALTSVPRALNNAAAIRTSIDSKSSGDNTPTHAGINDMVQQFAMNPPPAGSPPVIVLATDGLPNSCGSGGGEGPTVQAAAAAYAAGIPVYVLAINQNSQHFQDVANAGQGWTSGQPNVPYYPVTSAQQLKDAFDTIIRGVISCDLTLTSNIDPSAASGGTVVVNGMTLTYGTDWELVNGNVIRILGGACTSLKSSPNPMVSASFPCGSVVN